MSLAERQSCYQKIEDKRRTPLIVYATSTRPNVLAQNVLAIMAGDAVRVFIDQIEAISDREKVDVLIHSTGGDALAAWKLMSVLRERFKKVSVIVPFVAFSAATIFALGADEIVMHPHASLGPIDPQITVALPNGTQKAFSYEDVGSFLRFLSNEVKITEQAYISTIIEKLFSTVDPLIVGAAKRASELSSSVGERLLSMHMTGSEDKMKAKVIAENLNKSFFAHGDAVSRTRAKDLQLKIAPEDTVLETLIWDAYLALERYMELTKPFNPLLHYLSDNNGANSLRVTAPLILPPNMPPQMAQQVWQGVAQQAIQNLSNPGVEVEYEIINAVIESTRVASEYKTKGKVSAMRNVGGEIQVSTMDTESGWKNVN